MFMSTKNNGKSLILGTFNTCFDNYGTNTIFNPRKVLLKKGSFQLK